MFHLRQLLGCVSGSNTDYHALPLNNPCSTSSMVGKDADDCETRNAWIWGFLPWCITAPLGRTDRKLPKINSTSYLNGVRGLACFIVYTFHISGYYWNVMLDHGYGAGTKAENLNIVQLPIIRVLYAGGAMVSVFFVLSGFVMSYSSLRQINSTRFSADDLLTSLCSSIVRRGIRLFAPMILLAFITCFVSYFFPTFTPEDWAPNAADTFWAHAWVYVQIVLKAVKPFTWTKYYPKSFDHCWTLPAEYRGSIVIFLLCLVGSRLSTRVRKFGLIWCGLWSIYWDEWAVLTFISGMFLAELRFCPLADDHRLLNFPPHVKRFLAWSFLFLGLLFCSWPEAGADSQPYLWLSSFTPNTWRLQNATWNWDSIGAITTISALENIPPVQFLFCRKLFLYMGEISFGFYLLHWLFLFVIGHNSFKSLYAMGWSTNFSWWAQYLLTTVFLVGAADLWWRTVDERCVRFGKVFAKWLGIYEPRRRDIVEEEYVGLLPEGENNGSNSTSEPPRKSVDLARTSLSMHCDEIDRQALGTRSKTVEGWESELRDRSEKPQVGQGAIV